MARGAMLTDLFLQLFFKRWSPARQAEFMKRRGIVVGTRNKNGRTGYIYMVNNLFTEILYEKDNPRLRPEAVIVIKGLQGLNRHLEKELR